MLNDPAPSPALRTTTAPDRGPCLGSEHQFANANGVAIATRGKAKIGPNSVIQMRDTLLDRYDAQFVRDLFKAARIEKHLDHDPQAMIDEDEPVRLFKVLEQALPGAERHAILSEAGRRTAHYILQHRIPPLAQVALKAMPAPVAARVLTRAIEKHAWTFVGSGAFAANMSGFVRTTVQITVLHNPLATDNCPWHMAIFNTLYSELVSKRITLEHTRCCGRGAHYCCTEISI